MISNIVAIAVLALAAYGGYTLWKAKSTQDGYTAAKRTYDKVEKAAKAAHGAWK
jgi:predicted negative regulator of RcsB-dependent stress response